MTEIPELGVVDGGVPLSRGDRLVPEQHLHRARVAGAASRRDTDLTRKK
jgi:hypothetical protein